MQPELATPPPHNLDAEESVLGAMMLSPKAVEACVDVLSGREFYRESHGSIYTAMLALYAKGQPCDAITVVDELGRTGTLEAAGGSDRVHEIATLVPSSSNAKHYAEIVRETWLARGLMRAGQQIGKLGLEGVGSAEERIAEADTLVGELQALMERKRDTVFTGKQLVAEFREKLANPVDEEGIGVRPAFPFLPSMLGGRLYVLGGYQGDGKTALAKQFLKEACRGEARVGFGSIEMSRSDLFDRLVSTYGVPYSQVRTGNVSPEYMQRLEPALVEVESWDFEVIDDESLEPAAIRRHQRRGKYDLLILDHLHRIRIKDRRHAREELEESIRAITNIAREFDVPILLLAQLSRGDFRDPFPRPTMASLRGSGMIEAEAAAVWFVWRKRDKLHQQLNDAEFIIAKNRFGPVGWQNLGFISSQVRFEWQRGL